MKHYLLAMTLLLCSSALQADDLSYKQNREPVKAERCECGCHAPCHCGCTEGHPCSCTR